MAKNTVVKSVKYTLLGNPNNRQIERLIDQWEAKGYRCTNQLEVPSGCFLFRYMGKTRLTFQRTRQD